MAFRHFCPQLQAAALCHCGERLSSGNIIAGAHQHLFHVAVHVACHHAALVAAAQALRCGRCRLIALAGRFEFACRNQTIVGQCLGAFIFLFRCTQFGCRRSSRIPVGHLLGRDNEKPLSVANGFALRHRLSSIFHDAGHRCRDGRFAACGRQNLSAHGDHFRKRRGADALSGHSRRLGFFGFQNDVVVVVLVGLLFVFLAVVFVGVRVVVMARRQQGCRKQ